MPFNNLISRADKTALIPEEVSREVLTNVGETSAVLKLARRLANMSRGQLRMPVLSALATAYFVDPTDVGLKHTTEVNWANRYVDAEEIAVIVPIPQTVLDDQDYDIWSEVRPELERAFGALIDAAVLYGTAIPASWTVNMGGAGLLAVCTAAAQVISAAAYADDYEAILGVDGAGVAGLFGLVEADGYGVTGSIAPLAMKGRLRNIRDALGSLIFKTSMQGPSSYELDGSPILFPTNGAINGTYLLISGQWNQLVYSMRQDMTYKIFTEGVVTDAGGNVVFNLMQQDMAALRATMRLGVALPNPINAVNQVAVTRCAFAMLTA